MSSETKVPKNPTKKKPPAKKQTKRKRYNQSSDTDNAHEDVTDKKEKQDDEGWEDIKHSDDDDNEADYIKYYQEDEEEGKEYGKYQKYHRDKAWKLKKIAHHLLPSFNITSQKTDLSKLRVFPLAKLNVPHAIYVNAKRPEDIDFCHRRTIALNAYMVRVRNAKTSYKNAKKKSKTVRKNEKKGIYDPSILEFARRIEYNPDKFFERDYDFYYTGGNLGVNHRSNQIAHVAGTHMNTLVLSALKVVDNIPQVHQITSADIKSDDPNETEIFEVQFSSSADDYIFMRRKFNVSILQYTDESLNIVHNFKSKNIPFISFTQDPVETNHLAITDLLHRIRLCDRDQGNLIRTITMMSKDEVKPSNNWNMIKSLDRNVYAYAMDKKLTVIDTRLPDSEWRSSNYATTPETECYNFCSLARSKFGNLFYVGANHKTYCVDRRFMRKDLDSKKAAVVCWTHQMSSFPLMMATSCRNNVEYIAMQSPVSSDFRICELMRCKREPEPIDQSSTKKARLDLQAKYDYKSPCLPFLPPSIEILHSEVRLEGKCLNPTSGMCDRVKACMTGLDFVHEGPVSYLLTASSNGDLFARSMYNPDDKDVIPDTSTAADVMSRFEEKLLQTVPIPPLNVTQVVDLKGIAKVFACMRLDKDENSEYNLPRRRKYLGRWQKSLYQLSLYKDALASSLMDVWGFEIEEEASFNLGALDQTEKPESKVAGWLEKNPDIASTTVVKSEDNANSSLEKNQEIANSTLEKNQPVANSTMVPMTSIPMDVLNESNISFGVNDSTLNQTVELDQSASTSKPRVESYQTASTSKPRVELDQTASTSKPTVELDQTASTSKPKVAKKKKRYVKGF